MKFFTAHDDAANYLNSKKKNVAITETCVFWIQYEIIKNYMLYKNLNYNFFRCCNIVMLISTLLVTFLSYDICKKKM